MNSEKPRTEDELAMHGPSRPYSVPEIHSNPKPYECIEPAQVPKHYEPPDAHKSPTPSRDEGIFCKIVSAPSMDDIIDRLLNPARYEKDAEHPISLHDIFVVENCDPERHYGYHDKSSTLKYLRRVKILGIKREPGPDDIIIVTGECMVHQHIVRLDHDMVPDWHARFKAHYDSHGPEGILYLKPR